MEEHLQLHCRQWYGMNLQTGHIFKFMSLENEAWKLPAINGNWENWLSEDPINRCKLAPQDPRIKAIKVWKLVSSGMHQGFIND